MDTDIAGATAIGSPERSPVDSDGYREVQQDYQIDPKVSVLTGDIVVDAANRKLLEHFTTPSGKAGEEMWSLFDFLPLKTMRLILREGLNFNSSHRGWDSDLVGEIKVTVEITARRTFYEKVEDSDGPAE